MDAYIASTIKKSLLSRSYQNSSRKPKEYYRYFISQLSNKQIPAGMFPSEPHELGVVQQTIPFFPRTVIGLVEARKGDRCLFEIGVTVAHSLVVVPVALESDWQVEFYTCFNANKYYKKISVRSVFPNKRIGYSVLTLEEPVSHIVGAAQYIYTFDTDQRAPGEERTRGYRRERGGRRDREQREPRREPRRDPRIAPRDNPEQKAEVWRFVDINGVVCREMVETSIEELEQLAKDDNFQGICFNQGRDDSLKFLGMMRNGLFTALKHEDLLALIKNEENMLSCRQMSLSNHQIQWIGSKQWENMVMLDLSMNNINAYSCKPIANFHWRQLKEFHLRQNNIGPQGCSEIIKANLPQLRVLNLRNTLIDSEGCRWLSYGDWPQLSELNLRANEITSSGCEWLTRGNWPNLKKLNLSKNSFGDLGCAELVKGRWALQILGIKDCMIEDRGCKWLSRAKWPSLLELDLEENNFTNTGLKWLTKANWRSLTTFLIKRNMLLNSEGCTHLSQFKLPFLFALSVSMNQNSLCNLQLLKRNFSYLSVLQIHRVGLKKEDNQIFDAWSKFLLLDGVVQVQFEELR